MHALGKHLLIELHECSAEKIGNLEYVKETMMNAALEAKATIVEVTFHEFSPHGISGVVVIAESHLTIHSWPEYCYAAIDVFTCGDLIDPKVAADYLIEKFESESASIVEMSRGTSVHERKHKINLMREMLP